jgi:hypothetical protein
MAQADTKARSVTPKAHMGSIEEVTNLLAAYRRWNEDRSLESAQETDCCLSVSVELPVVQQLAQFDKLLVVLR